MGFGADKMAYKFLRQRSQEVTLLLSVVDRKGTEDPVTGAWQRADYGERS